MKLAILTSSKEPMPLEAFVISERPEAEIKKALDSYNPDLVILADYNKIIRSPELLEKYKNKFINIHLSYLPEFPGYKAHEQAWKAKAKVSGYTLHRIVKEVDKGEILKQERVSIEDCKSAEEVKAKIFQAAAKGLKTFLYQSKPQPGWK